MKKILIADDEFLVRLGLKTTINWEESGFIIVGEAKNGKEALELFEKTDPDILLTDIRMPVMDGLELIQILKSRKKSLKAVILSHYDDFNYAREALKLGASEYILKSDLSTENLLSVLTRLSDEIDSTEGSYVKLSTKEAPAEDEKEYKLDELLEKFIDGSIKSTNELLECLGNYEALFRLDSFVFLYASIEDAQSIAIDNDKQVFSRNIRNISKQVFESKNLIYSLNIQMNYFVLMINLSSEDGGNRKYENLLNICDALKNNIKQFLDIDISIGLSEVSDLKSQLFELFEQARIAQQYCFFETTRISVFNKNMVSCSGACPVVSFEVLMGYVKTLETDKLSLYIDGIFEDLFQLKNVELVKDVFIDLLSYAKIISKELNLKKGPALSEAKFSYSNFDKLYSLVAVKKYLMDIYYSMVDYIADNKSNSYSFVINKSVEFVKQNYQKNIALADAAEYVEISKSYLSLLFKQETGINFTAYLTNYRIEVAKKLLISSNCKIYEIAERVGFENPYYFSKVFRDITGVTCKDYKKNYYLKDSFDSKFS